MSKNYVQDGTTVEWVNDSGKTVVSGELVVKDNLVGVAHADISQGSTGVLRSEEHTSELKSP